MNDQSLRRILRTAIQLIAGGALYGLTQQIAGDIDDTYAPYVILGYTFLVNICQNLLEDTTDIPAVFKGDASGAKNPKPVFGPK